MKTAPAAVKARLLVHQEGVIGLLAVLGLAWSEAGPLVALAPRGSMLYSLAVGAACGAALAVGLWSLRRCPPLRALEAWQRVLVGRWSPAEAMAVAFLSGLAEEALLRAVLQPVIGLWLAAGVFALLHVVPEGRLWFWPVMALGMGLVFGVLYERFGFPACAASHVVVNLVGLLRLGTGGERSAPA